jgi:DNA uptake protein ComE-like DNA-binding protein
MASLFKSVKEKFKDYLTFNYAERRGIMVLVILILITESVNALLPSLLKQETIDMSAFEAEIKRFEAALMLPDTLKERPVYPNQQNKQYPKQTIYKKKAFAERPPMMIEINTADSAQLVELYGIGPAFALRILKYRGMLGGFFSPEQLLEVYGMDSVRYEGIAKNIKVDSSTIARINVNEADFKTLLHHPYLDYETVKQICNYREQQGPITCSDSLRIVIGYIPMWEKVKHYIEYRVSNIE